MANVFHIKRNDTSRPWKYYPRSVGSASDFTGATVVFNMRPKGGGAKVSRAACTVGSDARGTYFLYEWQASDTDTAGDFEAEFEATLQTGKVETYPNVGYEVVNIDEDIG